MRPPVSRRGRLVATTALVVGLLASLAACTPHTSPSKEPTSMNAAEAHDEIDAVLTHAQDVVGGRWRSIDGGAEICTTTAGEPGAVFPFGRIGPGVPADQQQAVLDGVVAAWKKDGFPAVAQTSPPVQGVEVRQVGYPESGKGKDGIYLVFTVSINSTTLDAQSRCVPGDADQINEDRQKTG